MTTIHTVTRIYPRNVERIPLLGLFKEIKNQIVLLVKKEIALVKTEAIAEVKTETIMATGFIIAAVFGFLTLTMLLVTIVLTLSLILPGWAAGLIVSGLLLIVSATAAFIGWRKRIRSPLVRTKEILQSDITLVKEKLS